MRSAEVDCSNPNPSQIDPVWYRRQRCDWPCRDWLRKDRSFCTPCTIIIVLSFFLFSLPSLMLLAGGGGGGGGGVVAAGATVVVNTKRACHGRACKGCSFSSSFSLPILLLLWRLNLPPPPSPLLLPPPASSCLLPPPASSSSPLLECVLAARYSTHY